MAAPIIVFDLDGTLARTEAYWLPLVEELFHRVKERFGFTPALDQTRDVLKVLGKRIEDFLGQLFPQADPETLKEIYLMERALWQAEAGRHPFVLYDGTLEVLEKLQARGFRLFVASNCKIHYLERMLEETGLGDFIEKGVCHGHWPELEKWEFTRKMLEDVNWEKGFFVGDSIHDMQAGRENGMTTIYAAYGYPSPPPADLVDVSIKDIQQLLDVLDV